MINDLAEHKLRIVDRDDDTVLDLAPLQGLWTEEQYIAMTNFSRRLLEFADGAMEVLPMPTPRHQKILALLYRSFFVIVQAMGGIVLFAPLRVQVRPGKYREPDLVVLCDAADPRQDERFWQGADLVVEIVSPDDPERDTVTKRLDYAMAHIPEYWIVDPAQQTITVLTLVEDVYVEYGVFGRGEVASSLLLTGLDIDVTSVLDAG
ncbi:MAG: Uma2 family endonuclease [Herpetosiphonaceae bacterium]|nr:Uma2 family endonuclease [Herpetosiphonaceae bacterium]